MVHAQLTKEKLLRRLELGVDRPDLIEGLLKKQKEWVSGFLTRKKATRASET